MGSKGQSVNNLGLLRLLLAGLVIVSHTSEIIDGNRSREILTRLFHTLSLGEVAVDGFFVISGYLITASACRHRPWPFLLNRSLRIYPGFMVAYLLCVLVVAPLAGAAGPTLSVMEFISELYNMMMLKPPVVAEVFAGLPYPELNAAMWTLAYEFRCYLLAAALGIVGCYRCRLGHYAYTLSVLLCLLLNAHGFNTFFTPGSFYESLLGNPYSVVRFWAAFGVGGMFYLFRDRISLSGWAATFSTIAAVASLCLSHVAEAGLLLFGGYTLFWLAFAQSSSTGSSLVMKLAALATRTDLSYGTYLYGWPAGMVILYHWREIPPVLLGTLTLAVAAGMGWLSWNIVEEPALRLKDAAWLDPRISWLPRFVRRRLTASRSR